MEFSERLRALRNERKLSQRKAAEAVGLSWMQYRRYEAGSAEPTLSNLNKLADFFEVSLDYLAGRVDDHKYCAFCKENIALDNDTCQACKNKTEAAFTNRIRECRLTEGLTQKKMGAVFGLSMRGWQVYEHGKNMPPADKLVEIADYFNVSIDYLLGRTDDPTALTLRPNRA